MHLLSFLLFFSFFCSFQLPRSLSLSGLWNRKKEKKEVKKRRSKRGTNSRIIQLTNVDGQALEPNIDFRKFPSLGSD